jgi:methionyl-tRNA formyltransferase
MRGFAPWPGTFAEFRGKRVHLWGRPASAEGPFPNFPTGVAPGAIRVDEGRIMVACGGNSWLELKEMQPEGRRRMTAREFLSGARIGPDERFQ